MKKHVCNHTIHDHQCHFGWNKDNPPVVRISPGETVEFHPVDSSGGQLNARSTLADLAVLDFGKVNPVAGQHSGIWPAGGPIQGPGPPYLDL
jgi:acetamidase/formamidase